MLTTLIPLHKGFIRIFCAIYLVFFIVCSESYASSGLSLSSGLSALEEGDTRYRPAAWFQTQWSPRWATTLHYWGRSQQPVLQENYLLTQAYLYPLFGSKYFSARTGLVVAWDRTHINRSSGSPKKATESNRNLGLHLGIGWQSASRLHFEMNWGAHIFPAGYGVIYLATARKQDISFGLGWSL